MLAGFCGWAVLLDAPARLELTVPQDMRERESSVGGAMGHVFARTASDLWRSRKSFRYRGWTVEKMQSPWNPHGDSVSPTSRVQVIWRP